MNSKESLRRRFLQLMTENVKSELLLLMADNNEATSSILADPYGKISHKTLDIITTTLTPLMLQRLKHNINAWVNEELSPPCLWDSRYACQQKCEFSTYYHQSSGSHKILPFMAYRISMESQ